MYTQYNRKHVMEAVNKYLSIANELRDSGRYEWDNMRHYGKRKRLWVEDCYKDLSIFDAFKDSVSVSDLKSMKAFLETAGALGYNGYVCFKVGASGCANGMWAYKEESADGFSPDGEFLYRSFTPDYTSWDARLCDGRFAKDFCNDKTYKNMSINDVMKAIILSNAEMLESRPSGSK